MNIAVCFLWGVNKSERMAQVLQTLRCPARSLGEANKRLGAPRSVSPIVFPLVCSKAELVFMCAFLCEQTLLHGL